MILKSILFFLSSSCFVHISHGQTFSDITVNDGEPLVVGMTSTQFIVTSSDGGGIHSICVYLDKTEVYKFTIISKFVTAGTAAAPSARFEYISPQDSTSIADANNIVITVAIKDIVIRDNGVTTLLFRNSAGSASSNHLVFNVSSCHTISGTSVTSSALAGGGACTFGTYNCTSTFACDSGLTLVDSTQATRTCGKQAKWMLNGTEDTNICEPITCDRSSLVNKYPNITVTDSNSTFSYNATATVECDVEGFEPNSTNCTCSQPNSWSCEEDIICTIQASSRVTANYETTPTGQGKGGTTEGKEGCHNALPEMPEIPSASKEHTDDVPPVIEPSPWLLIATVKNKCDSQPPDEDELFFSSLLPLMKTLDGSAKFKLKIELMKVIQQHVFKDGQ